MPIPPPPAAALMITGKPISLAIAAASAGSETGPGEPLAIGNPALDIVSRAVILSPRILNTSGLGPMNVIPSSANLSAKIGFSARNPYPG